MRSPAEQFLIDLHAAQPGATAQAFGALPVRIRDREFASSYEVLAAAVPREGAPLTVLDLACGSGFLLSLLAARGQSGLELIGVDMSAAELRMAAADLGGQARLLEARAQDIPVPSHSVNVVVCHMALMLMGNADPVLAESMRVLKPGGSIAAVVGGHSPPSPAFDTYVRVINSHARASFLRLGDPRFRTDDGIREIFAPHCRELQIDEVHIRRKLTVEATWAWFERMYDIYQIDESARDAVRSDYLSSVAQHCAEDGLLDFPQTLRYLEARAL